MKGPSTQTPIMTMTKSNLLSSETLDFSVYKRTKFKFLDMINYLAPGTSYAKYLKAFNVTSQKGFFPYEYITSLSVLEETTLPPHEAFYSSLKKSNITEEDYQYCQQVWNDNNMTSLKDFLKWYVNSII